MESTIDLILKGHFEHIREQVNRNLIKNDQLEELEVALKDVLTYLENQSSEEAEKLKNRLVELLPVLEGHQAQAVLQTSKKPMQKAGKKPKSGKQRKAM